MSTVEAPSRPTLFNWIEIAALGLIWGGSFLSVHVALTGFGPLMVAAGRIAIAAITLTVLCVLLRLPLPSLHADRRVWWHALGMAVFTNALPFAVIAWAQQSVQSSFVGITMALVPLFTLVMAHFALPGERLTWPRAAGFVLGLVGVVVLIGVDGLTLAGDPGHALAQLSCVGVTISYALGSIFTRRCPAVDPVAFSTAALLLAAAMILPVALTIEGVPAVPPAPALWALAYLGLMPTAFATLILVHVVRSAGPTFLTQTNYQVPVWSVLFGTLLLSEPLPPQFLIALGLILTGLAVSRMARR